MDSVLFNVVAYSLNKRTDHYLNPIFQSLREAIQYFPDVDLIILRLFTKPQFFRRGRSRNPWAFRSL
jgi:hypothetical protein